MTISPKAKTSESEKCSRLHKSVFPRRTFQGKIEAWGSDSAQAKGFPGYALPHFSNVNENKQKSDGTGRELP